MAADLEEQTGGVKSGPERMCVREDPKSGSMLQYEDFSTEGNIMD